MELVKGLSITAYCDKNRLSTRERLELFSRVCSAIEHAHQKGIIHRDIKPSNVLIAEYDDAPVPKVIDFGVAKAISQQLVDAAMFTHFGQILGTLEYMSPEQAKLNQWDIDTRSDIYSLGVLLYELLIGNTPFEGARLRNAAIDEVLRIIREEEPPKPSVRLTTDNNSEANAQDERDKAREETKRANRESKTAEVTLQLVSMVLRASDGTSADDSISLNEQVNDVLAKRPDLSPDIESRVRLFMGQLLHNRSENQIARRQLKRAYELLDSSSSPKLRKDVLTNLVYVSAGAASQKYLRELGPLVANSPGEKATNLGLLAQALMQEGKQVEAQALAQESLGELVATIGSDHPSTGWGHKRLGDCYLSGKHLPEAVREFREARRIFANNGIVRFQVRSLTALGGALADDDKTIEAVDCLRQSVELGIDRRDSRKWAAGAATRLAKLFEEFRDFDNACRFHAFALDARKITNGPESQSAVDASLSLGIALSMGGRTDKAIGQFQACLDTMRRKQAAGVIVWGAGNDLIFATVLQVLAENRDRTLEELLEQVEIGRDLMQDSKSTHSWAELVRGLAYQFHGETNLARACYEKSNQIANPRFWSYAVAEDELIKLECANEDFDAAERIIRAGIESRGEESIDKTKAMFLNLELADVLI